MKSKYKVGDEVGGCLIETQVAPCNGKNGRRWLLRCTCGKTFERTTVGLGDGRSIARCSECRRRAQSENAKRNRTHGLSKTRLYRRWIDMRRRCYSEADASYVNYGGRGIRVSDEWDDFEKFREYVETHLGPRPSVHHSLDRIDNDGNYEPGNIRWADPVEQLGNRRVERKSWVPDTAVENPIWVKRLQPFLQGPMYVPAKVFGTNARWISKIAQHHGLIFATSKTQPE